MEPCREKYRKQREGQVQVRQQTGRCGGIATARSKHFRNNRGVRSPRLILELIKPLVANREDEGVIPAIPLLLLCLLAGGFLL